MDLMQQLAGGTVLKGAARDLRKEGTPDDYITYSNINGLLGTHISHDAITRALQIHRPSYHERR